MGITQVTVEVRNPASLEAAWSGLFLVDTGAVDCMVPGRHLRELGITPAATRQYELADGTKATFEVGGARLEFMGEIVWVSVIFGPDGAEPILGVTALEPVGIEVDPRSQRLKRMPSVRLKGLRSDSSLP